MKIFTGILIFTVILLAAANGVSAQTGRTPVWAVDFVKTKPGEQANYLKFVEQNWARAREFMKSKGIAASYRAVWVPADDRANWDVLLMTEYVDRAGFERREAVFDEYRKANAAVAVGGKNSRALADIKFSRLFTEPISKEAAEIMLKTQNENPEIAAARLPLENYLQGHATGKGEFHQAAFYPESRLLFARDGKLMQRTSAEYIKGASGKPADDEAKRRRSIEMVEVTGNAAIGKIVLDYPTAYFVDYFALLKIGGEWKIVNKSFHVQPRADANEKIAFRMTDEDKKAVAVPLENYLKAHATGTGDYIRQAFHAETKVMSLQPGGKFAQLSTEQFAAFFTKGTPAPDEAQRRRSFEILDVAGSAAIAKVVLDYPNVKFTDYMTLLKIDGEWKIINKSFHAESKQSPKK